MNRFLSLLAILLTALLPSLTQAGSSEAGAPVLPRHQVAAFADGLERDLAARGANVAIVARVGRAPKICRPASATPMSPFGSFPGSPARMDPAMTVTASTTCISSRMIRA